MRKNIDVPLFLCLLAVGCIPPKFSPVYSEMPDTSSSVPESSVPGEVPSASPVARVLPFAGSGNAGYLDGPEETAEFNAPEGLAFDVEGNLFFADSGNQRIRKISLDGRVSTFAGIGEAGRLDGAGNTASFNHPSDLAIDSLGYLYLADSNNHVIRKISPDALVSTFAGSGESGFLEGKGKAAEFDTPLGIAVDQSGNVFVADTWNQRIRKIDPQGLVSTLAGCGISGCQDGAGLSAKFNHPQGVAVDQSGNVYVADTWNHRIRKIDPQGLVSTLAGSGESGFLDGTASEARFYSPSGLAVNGEGSVFVGESPNHRVRKISPEGTVSTLAGDGGYGYKDGPAATARFKSADKLAFDGKGDVYVSDTLNQRIRKISLF